MKKIIYATFIIFISALMLSSCNIVPKSVQYQKEEEALVGSTDTINPRIEEIQVVLINLGYDTDNTDGRMGQKTREAIKEFQESIGVKATGYIDKLTLTQIEDTRRAKEMLEVERDYTVTVRSPYSKEEDSQAEFRPTTKEIQFALKNAGFDPGAIDGKMGPMTQQAIKEFQRVKGLKVDGIVGAKTWRELGKYLEK